MASPVSANNALQGLLNAAGRGAGSPAAERQADAAGGKVQPPAAAPGRAPEPVSREAVAQAVEAVDSYLQSVDRGLRISVDETLGTTVIKVLDESTEEVVRQIPSEEVLALARYMSEQLAAAEAEPATRGLLLDSQG